MIFLHQTPCTLAEEEDEGCGETVKAKDLMIKKLETQIETLQQDIKKLVRFTDKEFLRF